MAFVCEKISAEERRYFETIGFTNISNKPSETNWWAIDREKNIILICRGGIPGEIFWGYQLYLEGEFINMIVIKKTEGDRFSYDLRINWIIEEIRVPKKLVKEGCDIKKIIEEAFISFGMRGLKASQLLSVNVQINKEFDII